MMTSLPSRAKNPSVQHCVPKSAWGAIPQHGVVTVRTVICFVPTT